MENQFCPYEQALALKELGFDEPCFGYYYHENSFTKCRPQIYYSNTFTECNPHEEIPLDSCKSPLYQQAFRWFREKYGLISFILPFALLENNGLWCYEITDFSNNWDESSDIHSPEEAELACLRKLIEIVKKQK